MTVRMQPRMIIFIVLDILFQLIQPKKMCYVFVSVFACFSTFII